jgi:UDP-glucose 4-epimerase
VKILFTGSSSFTGYWFIKTLAAAGHAVVACFGQPTASYNGVRKQRIQETQLYAECVFESQFGSKRFMEIVGSESHWDVLCHHAAETRNYKSPSFDYIGAVQKNCFNLRLVLEGLESRGTRALVITGSAFEADEGAGEKPIRAFSPYGLSKTLTWKTVEFTVTTAGLKTGKFVIANPFGPLEEARFVAYLMKSWLRGDIASVMTPLYVRDNIHVDLLAKTYARFVHQTFEGNSMMRRTNPSGYIESQGAFTRRISEAMKSCLNLPCEFRLENQQSFTEPLIRVNTEPAAVLFPDWSEDQSWRRLAEYYSQQFDA